MNQLMSGKLVAACNSEFLSESHMVLITGLHIQLEPDCKAVGPILAVIVAFGLTCVSVGKAAEGGVAVPHRAAGHSREEVQRPGSSLRLHSVA